MNLGAFSVSLAVKDLRASFEFYQKLGFTECGGNIEQNWLIVENGTTRIGLFQGMFEDNILTFNPGWNAKAEPLDEFTDVRVLEQQLEARGLSLIRKTEADSEGPASITLLDPDNNPILIDQHV